MRPATCLTLLFGFLVLILAIPTLLSADAPTSRVETRFDGARFDVCYTAAFSSEALELGRRMGYDTVEMENCGYLMEAGRPKLPGQTVRIALPAGMKVTDVGVRSVVTIDLPGEYDVYPAQPPTPISEAFGLRGFVGKDPEIYGSPDPYPSQWVEFAGQTDLAGQNIAMIRIHPLRYTAAAKRLTMATSIEIVIEGTPGYVSGDYLPTQISDHARANYERMLAEAVVNPEDIELVSSAAPASRGVGPGQYEYAIITQADWVDDFQPLADWRIKKGIPTTIVTTDWIYNSGGYSGTNLDKMRAFIIDAHSTWGAACFLFGADSNVIPYHTRTIGVPTYDTLDIDNDTYCADYDDDWVLEVTIARASPRTTTDISTFINKTLTYEKSPPLTDYATMAAFVGFDISTCGDLYGENHKDNYVRPHLPPNWTLNTEYDSESGGHKADVLALLGQGHHLFNHHDHCNTDCMGTGWTCHSALMFNSDVTALTNGDRQSIAIAVGCYPAHFPTNTCIGEAFLRNPNGGGVAFIGNTCLGWGGDAVNPDYYSARQDRFFYRNLFDDGFDRLGDNFTDLKNDEFDPNDPYNVHKWCFTQLHLLGEPMLTVWTQDPQSLAVTHFESIPTGQSSDFVVQVSSGRNPVDDATVCLWKDGDVYEVQQTVSGAATFAVTPATPGTLYVTVSRQNYLPYEGSAIVDDYTSVASGTQGAVRELALESITPNPFNPITEISYAIPAGDGPARAIVTIYDALGRKVRNLVDTEKALGIHRAVWDGKDDRGTEVASGIYFCRLTWSGRSVARPVVLLK